MDRTPIGPHVVQNMNRCIHCTRCIRFTQEISGTSELAFFKRGASTEVGVFAGVPLDNWMSACVTDICPTGALTTREFRFESRVWNLDSTESVCNGCDVGCNIFIGHRNGQVYRYRPRVNPDVNDHWLCDYGRFSHEKYDTDRVVVPKVRHDDYLGISTWSEAMEAIVDAVRDAKSIGVIASSNMTNEEASLAKQLFVDRMGAKPSLTVDPIAPIKMKSKTEWLEGTQAAPNYRGVSAILGASPSVPSVPSVPDVLFVLDAHYTKSPDIEALRKSRFLVVISWDANHPLAEAADVLLPGTIHPEKEGTFTNLQNRVQRIHQAFAPKGQAVSELELFRRIGAALYSEAEEFRSLPEMQFEEETAEAL
jgi:NADH-quinone oxidoreductase subunit G